MISRRRLRYVLALATAVSALALAVTIFVDAESDSATLGWPAIGLMFVVAVLGLTMTIVARRNK